MEDPIVVEAVDEESIASDILSPKDSSCALSPSVSPWIKWKTSYM